MEWPLGDRQRVVGTETAGTVIFKCFRLVVLGLALLALATAREAPSRTPVTPPSAASADEMVALWKAKKRFGPDARGVDHSEDGSRLHRGPGGPERSGCDGQSRTHLCSSG